jgi:hypothetical protein
MLSCLNMTARYAPYRGLSQSLGQPTNVRSPMMIDSGAGMAWEQAAEVRRLWADYYEASARALEIMRVEGTTGAVLPRVALEAAKADAALKRLKEIHGLGG